MILNVTAQKEQLGGFAAEENVRLKMEIEAFRRDKYKLNSEMEGNGRFLSTSPSIFASQLTYFAFSVNNLQLQDKEIKMSSILMNNEMLQKDIDRLESEIKGLLFFISNDLLQQEKK